MATYWQNLDEWLVETIQAITGIGDVVIGESVNPDKLEGIGAMVQSLSSTSEPFGHGNGKGVFRQAYPVAVCLWVTGADVAAAKYAALPYVNSLWGLVYDETIFQVTGEDGEHTESLTPGRIDIYLRDRGTVKGGVANVVVRFVVFTEK